ncbi:MAG: hypothetical protein PHY48_17830 [Candidatus Cloacimonetes bacterium]|nr:hypothetical protein [Candidatus Cloacimonadota bacterium]
MFNISSGYETGNIKSYQTEPGAVIKSGTWVVFSKTSGKLIPQVGLYDPAVQGITFPVFGGNDVRFDSKAMGVVSCVTASSFAGETDEVAAVTIVPGDFLTVQDGQLTKANLATASAFSIVGSATSAVNGVVEFIRK